VLSDQERRSWNEIERSYAGEPGTIGNGARGRASSESPGGDGFRALATGAIGLALLSALVGAWVAGLVIIVTFTLGWVLWHHWDDIGEACARAVLPVDGQATDDAPPRHGGRTPGAN
jgi:hypothetical protein